MEAKNFYGKNEAKKKDCFGPNANLTLLNGCMSTPTRGRGTKRLSHGSSTPKKWTRSRAKTQGPHVNRGMKKVFFDEQRYQLKVRYPFLTPEQINGKVLKIWNSMSQEQQDTYNSVAKICTPRRMPLPWLSMKSPETPKFFHRQASTEAKCASPKLFVDIDDHVTTREDDHIIPPVVPPVPDKPEVLSGHRLFMEESDDDSLLAWPLGTEPGGVSEPSEKQSDSGHNVYDTDACHSLVQKRTPEVIGQVTDTPNSILIKKGKEKKKGLLNVCFAANESINEYQMLDSEKSESEESNCPEAEISQKNTKKYGKNGDKKILKEGSPTKSPVDIFEFNELSPVRSPPQKVYGRKKSGSTKSKFVSKSKATVVPVAASLGTKSPKNTRNNKKTERRVPKQSVCIAPAVGQPGKCKVGKYTLRARKAVIEKNFCDDSANFDDEMFLFNDSFKNMDTETIRVSDNHDKSNSETTSELLSERKTAEDSDKPKSCETETTKKRMSKKRGRPRKVRKEEQKPVENQLPDDVPSQKGAHTGDKSKNENSTVKSKSPKQKSILHYLKKTDTNRNNSTILEPKNGNHKKSEITEKKVEDADVCGPDLSTSKNQNLIEIVMEEQTDITTPVVEGTKINDVIDSKGEKVEVNRDQGRPLVTPLMFQSVLDAVFNKASRSPKKRRRTNSGGNIIDKDDEKEESFITDRKSRKWLEKDMSKGQVYKDDIQDDSVSSTTPGKRPGKRRQKGKCGRKIEKKPRKLPFKGRKRIEDINIAELLGAKSDEDTDLEEFLERTTQSKHVQNELVGLECSLKKCDCTKVDLEKTVKNDKVVDNDVPVYQLQLSNVDRFSRFKLGAKETEENNNDMIFGSLSPNLSVKDGPYLKSYSSSSKSVHLQHQQEDSQDEDEFLLHRKDNYLQDENNNEVEITNKEPEKDTVDYQLKSPTCHLLLKGLESDDDDDDSSVMIHRDDDAIYYETGKGNEINNGEYQTSIIDSQKQEMDEKNESRDELLTLAAPEEPMECSFLTEETKDVNNTENIEEKIQVLTKTDNVQDMNDDRPEDECVSLSDHENFKDNDEPNTEQLLKTGNTTVDKSRASMFSFTEESHWKRPPEQVYGRKKLISEKPEHISENNGTNPSKEVDERLEETKMAKNFSERVDDNENNLQMLKSERREMLGSKPTTEANWSLLDDEINFDDSPGAVPSAQRDPFLGVAEELPSQEGLKKKKKSQKLRKRWQLILKEIDSAIEALHDNCVSSDGDLDQENTCDMSETKQQDLIEDNRSEDEIKITSAKTPDDQPCCSSTEIFLSQDEKKSTKTEFKTIERQDEETRSVSHTQPSPDEGLMSGASVDIMDTESKQESKGDFLCSMFDSPTPENVQDAEQPSERRLVTSCRNASRGNFEEMFDDSNIFL